MLYIIYGVRLKACVEHKESVSLASFMHFDFKFEMLMAFMNLHLNAMLL